MEEGVARIPYELYHIVRTDGAAVLHAVQQLGIMDEDGKVVAGPVLAAKLFGAVGGGVPTVHRRHQQVRLGEVLANFLQHSPGLLGTQTDFFLHFKLRQQL